MRLCVLFISVIFSTFLIAQEGAPAVAVLDFEPKGLPDYEAETLTERLRSEIANTKAVRLTDRKLLEKILNEQGLQQLSNSSKRFCESSQNDPS